MTNHHNYYRMDGPMENQINISDIWPEWEIIEEIGGEFVLISGDIGNKEFCKDSIKYIINT